MNIVFQTENDFVMSEVSEWGWDYVEAKFDSGYEPTLINGVWCWQHKTLTNVSTLSTSTIALSTVNGSMNLSTLVR